VSRQASGLLRVAASAVCFGLLGIFARLAYDHGANVAGVVSARAMVVVPLFAVLALEGRHGPRRRRDSRDAWHQLVPMALLSIMASVTYFVAIDRASPALVTLVIYVYPAVTVLGSRLLGWTTLGTLAAVATGLTTAGVAVTLGLPEEAVDPLAVVLALVNGVGYAVFLLLAQVALRKTDSLTVYAAAGGPAAVVLLVGSFVVSNPSYGSGAIAVLSLVCAGVISTVLATILQFTGVRRLGSASAAVVTSLEIVTVVVGSAIVFGDPVGAGLVLGGLLVIAGAVLAPRGVRLVERPDAVRAGSASPPSATRSPARAGASGPRSPRE
jgi:drug/metabolite transporter (DMT)-like permease